MIIHSFIVLLVILISWSLFTVIPYFWEKEFDGLWSSQACCGKNIVEFTRLSKETLADDAIDSFFHKLSIQSNDDEDNGIKISAIYLKKDHERRKPTNWKMIEIELHDMKNANMRSIEEALNLRSSSIESLVLLIQDHFSSFIESEVIAATTCWPETLKYWVGVQQGQSYLMGRRCLFTLGWLHF